MKLTSLLWLFAVMGVMTLIVYSQKWIGGFAGLVALAVVYAAMFYSDRYGKK